MAAIGIMATEVHSRSLKLNKRSIRHYNMQKIQLSRIIARLDEMSLICKR